jgi:putative ABC transport system permease protein
MIKHYFKFALKILFKDRLYTFINLIGLSLALTCSFIIIIYLVNEYSYDTSHINGKHIYRVINHQKGFETYSPNSPFPLGTGLINDIPEIQKTTRLRRVSVKVYQNEQYHIENKFLCSDHHIFEILSIPLLAGNIDQLLREPFTVVISEEMADKYFHNENPIGQILQINYKGEKIDLKIDGVFKPLPWNSSLKADFISDMGFLIDYFKKENVDNNFTSDWTKNRFTTLVLLKNDIIQQDILDKMNGLGLKHLPSVFETEYLLQPFGSMYLDSDYIVNNSFRTGSKTDIFLFIGIGLLIIISASINYVILSSARSLTRLKEIGIRKVLGISKTGLVLQFQSESIIMALMAIPFAYLFTELLLPHMEFLFGKTLHFNLFQNLNIILLFLLLTIVVGILSGSYISYFIISNKPISFLTNQVQSVKGKSTLRQVLITVQLVIIVSLLSAAFIVYHQIQFGLNKDLGINKKGLVFADFNPKTLDYEVFKNTISENPNVFNVTAALFLPPTNSSASMKIPRFDDPNSEVVVEGIYTDFAFIETFGIKLIEGRTFSEKYTTDNTKSVILNESAVSALGIKNPIGKTILGKTVIGVVKDFNIHTINQSIKPVVFFIDTRYLRIIVCKINPKKFGETIAYLSEEWNKIDDSSVFNYRSFDDSLTELYLPEIKLSRILFIFSIIALIIGSLGLLGLSLFIVKQKTKEIVLRKVLGASTLQVFVRLTKYFQFQFILSFCLAIPFTWFFIEKWLRNYYYTIDSAKITWSFLLSGIISLILVTLVIGFQTYKASTIPPAKVLKQE